MSRWVGLTDKVTFGQGDATSLPFADRSFDAAMTIHVAMNIANKDALYRDAKRVLKPAVYSQFTMCFVGTVWAKAHDCIDALHALVRKVDLSCGEVEENPEISVSGIARRRAELCERISPRVSARWKG